MTSAANRQYCQIQPGRYRPIARENFRALLPRTVVDMVGFVRSFSESDETAERGSQREVKPKQRSFIEDLMVRPVGFEPTTYRLGAGSPTP